ncbi:NUDIX domain-containing protein [Natrialbaceae archaeon GCM10025810]|uniref:NUDIX hydrolase n=1 Tax=Halovalidus salilacus TaxID=3075124 RepID=UPI003613D545
MESDITSPSPAATASAATTDPGTESTDRLDSIPDDVLETVPDADPKSIPTVDKAYAYATRRSGGTLELLVFEQEKPGAGVQVPKGTVEDGEAPHTAVVRELAEESGVDAPLGVSHLTSDHWYHERRETLYRRHFYHVPVREPREAWDHAVIGGGEDDGLVFSCFWAEPASVSLSRDMDDYLGSIIP